MKVQKFIEVRLLKKRLTSPIDVVQYDTGVQLVFSLVDFDIPSGTTAILYVQKKSGKFVYQEKGITIAGNDITINLENQALTEHGDTPYQITLTNGSDTISTFAGVLRVERSLANSGATESKTVISAFEDLTADKLAEFRSEAEVIARQVIATIPEDYTVMEAKVNELANAVKGNLSGAVVFADDVSPVEHSPVVWVHGKNLFDVSKLSNITGKLTNNNDGTLTIAANQYAIPTGKKINELCPSLKAGVVCTLSFLSTSANTKYIWLNGANVMLYNSTYTFTDEMLNSELYLYGFRDTDDGYGSVCTISNIQIEEGTAATDYEPYIDPSTVKVKRCGKNFWHSRDLTYPRTVSGVTINYDPDSQIYTFNGTSTAPGDIYTVPNGTDIMRINAGETWTLKVEVMGGTIDGVATSSGKISPLVNTSSYTNTIHANTDSLYVTKTYTEAADITKMYFYIYASGTVFNNFKCRIQFEPNSKPTEFEKFKELSEYAPASDGTVSGLTSVSPNMTILTDTEGAIVECEYTKDTNKVIEKLTNAILALGGTV